jgi:hypothetical protein
MPSGYKGQLGVSGESGEWRTSAGGGPLALDDSRGECGGGGALWGGRVND